MSGIYAKLLILRVQDLLAMGDKEPATVTEGSERWVIADGIIE